MKKSTAKTILEQLGGNKFLAMTGAKNLATNGNDLTFKIGRNPKKVTHISIVLNGADLYDINFYSIKGLRMATLDSMTGIYAAQLEQVVSQITGLETRL